MESSLPSTRNLGRPVAREWISLRWLLVWLAQLILLSVLGFLLVRFYPGGPFSDQTRWPSDLVRSVSATYGYSDQWWQDYFKFIGSFWLAPSLLHPGLSVGEIFLRQFRFSVEIGGFSFLLSVLLALLLSWWSYWWSWYFKTSREITLFFARVFLSIPSVILAPLVLYAIHFGWGALPRIWGAGWESRILPIVVLAIRPCALLYSLIWQQLKIQEQMRWPLQSQALGLSDFYIWLSKMKLAIQAPLQLFPSIVIHLISTAVVVETLFNIPGLGTLFLDSLRERDLFLLNLLIFVTGGTLLFLRKFLSRWWLQWFPMVDL